MIFSMAAVVALEVAESTEIELPVGEEGAAVTANLLWLS